MSPGRSDTTTVDAGTASPTLQLPAFVADTADNTPGMPRGVGRVKYVNVSAPQCHRLLLSPPSAVTTLWDRLGAHPRCPSQVRLPDSPEQQPVSCAIVVAAAGAWTGKLLDSATAGLQGSLTLRRLPIEPRKRSGLGLSLGALSPRAHFCAVGWDTAMSPQVRLCVALPRRARPGDTVPHRHLGSLFPARGHRWQLPGEHEPT